MYVSRKAIKYALLGVIGFSASVYFINSQASKDAKETSVPDVDLSSPVLNSNEGVDATEYISYLSFNKIKKVTILLNKETTEDGMDKLAQDVKKIMDGDDSVDIEDTAPKKVAPEDLDPKKPDCNNTDLDSNNISEVDESTNNKCSGKKQTTLGLISILKDDNAVQDNDSQEWNDLLDELSKIYEASQTD